MARSRSRLNSAAPYDTHAWPPMSSALTRCARIEERTLSIGLGIKRAPQRQERCPKFAALAPSFGRRQAKPLGPLRPDEILGANLSRDCGFLESVGAARQRHSSLAPIVRRAALRTVRRQRRSCDQPTTMPTRLHSTWSSSKTIGGNRSFALTSRILPAVSSSRLT